MRVSAAAAAGPDGHAPARLAEAAALGRWVVESWRRPAASEAAWEQAAGRWDLSETGRPGQTEGSADGDGEPPAETAGIAEGADTSASGRSTEGTGSGTPAPSNR